MRQGRPSRKRAKLASRKSFSGRGKFGARPPYPLILPYWCPDYMYSWQEETGFKTRKSRKRYSRTR